jgi:pyruvate dehydrogenase E1 component
LQHQDGHSHVLASTVPTCASYDPAYAYEIAYIVRDGIRRMYQEDESRFYYLTAGNENYAQPEAPAGCQEGVLKGIYKLRPSPGGKPAAQLFGSGSILNEALRAQEILADRYQVSADVWSVTSYNQLRRDALAVERWNRLNPSRAARKPYVLEVLEDSRGPIVAATDYMKIVPDQLAPWLDGRLTSLGTDGFGRSDNRQHLRRHFEVGAEAIAAATLAQLARNGKFDSLKAQAAVRELGLDPDSPDPATL